MCLKYLRDENKPGCYRAWLRFMLRLRNIDGLLILTCFLMPSLTHLQFSQHPQSGHDNVWPHINQRTARGFELFSFLLTDRIKRYADSPWPPGLKSLRTIVVDLDEIHDLDRLDWQSAAYPKLSWVNIRPLLSLPNLQRLSVAQHPLEFVRIPFFNASVRSLLKC